MAEPTTNLRDRYRRPFTVCLPRRQILISCARSSQPTPYTHPQRIRVTPLVSNPILPMETSTLKVLDQSGEATSGSQAQHRGEIMRPVPEQPMEKTEEVLEPRRRLLPVLRKRISLSKIPMVPPPRTQSQAVISKYHAREFENQVMKGAEEFAAKMCASTEEREDYGKSVLLSTDRANAKLRNEGTGQSGSALAGRGQEAQTIHDRSSKDTCDSSTAVAHDSAIPAPHGKILSEVLADPSEFENTLDIDTLVDEQRPRHRGSGSVRFIQTDSEELQVAKWRALAMSLVYHVHLHNVNPDIKRFTPVREYCEGCDTTFETRRDLIVHRCPSIIDILEERISEKNIYTAGKGLFGRFLWVAKLFNPAAPRSKIF
ncbi:hypothetical protein BDY19DRAFT_904497 [Irpex rosettiformis]|uniref:Uncharacterized protein n=1 Tax=Irpex rosettiformis TaxID=378272 RepID=A0ACB8U9C7_9APHY|nr:hypothetical protein BDY19DRAFT_904497 [Irpex rosettiformis]